jgi:transcriptional regulator with XRE-family HTH domain
MEIRKRKKVSPANFAKKIEVSRARVSQLMKGILKSAIIRVPGKRRVLLDEAKATALYKAYSDPAKKRTGIIDEEYQKARMQTVRYQGKQLKLKYEETLAKYILKSEVKAQVAQAIQVIEAHKGKLAPAIVNAVAVETEKNKTLKIMRQEIDKFLKGLVKALNELP